MYIVDPVKKKSFFIKITSHWQQTIFKIKTFTSSTTAMQILIRMFSLMMLKIQTKKVKSRKLYELDHVQVNCRQLKMNCRKNNWSGLPTT